MTAADMAAARESTRIEALALGCGPDVASHVLWVYKATGAEPDGWTNDWIRLLMKAGEERRGGLMSASKPWGSYGLAVELAERGDFATLEALAARGGAR